MIMMMLMMMLWYPIETEEEKGREKEEGRSAQSPDRSRETLFLSSVPLILIFLPDS